MSSLIHKLLGAKKKIATIKYDGSSFEVVGEGMSSSTRSKDMWGISTNQWAKVSMVMNSPNHWDGEGVGNKHYMFMLEGCKNPEDTRGFYNEFLSNELMPHREVFEMLASSMKVPYSDEQLSGLGFSSTKKTSFLCKVSGTFNRTLKVNV